RAGAFPDSSRTLRAKVNMASPNLNMRDPVLYRILRAHHHRTGDKWCIYPMYDYAHGQSDSIEKITHSICTLEFENHRPLYDWYLDQLGVYHPQQIEFARLNITYTVMSKRKLLELVKGGYVAGWDDPRMPTLCGLRRRGYTQSAVLQGPLHRARRFHGEPSQEVLPAGARPRGASALRLFHHVQRCSEGSEDGVDPGIAMHLRSRNPRRQCAGWPQSARHD